MTSLASTAIALGGTAAGALFRALDGAGQWSIQSLDDAVPFRVVGRFPIRDGVTVRTSASYAVSQGLGDQGELVQFLSGQSDRVTVTVELHDTSFSVPFTLGFLNAAVDDLKSEIEQIQALARKHPTLRRSPRVRFTWGSEFYRDCMCETVRAQLGRISRTTGRIQQARLSLSFIEAPEVFLQETDPSAVEPESVEVVAEDGDTFELIAARAYADPDKGPQLRHRQTQTYAGILVSGAPVLVVDRDHTDLRAPDFLAPVMVDDGTGDFLTKFDEHMQARAGPQTVAY